MSFRRSLYSNTPQEQETRQRKSQDGFLFPYGSFPEETFTQRVGYDSKFIREGGYFYYQIALSHDAIMPTLLKLFNTLPEQVYLVTQIHTDDYNNEYDTYVSKGAVDKAELVQWIIDWQDIVLDDGCFGVGMFVEYPSMEVFIDEHKTIHVYHHNPEVMEHKLAEMDIPFILDLKFFWDTPHLHLPLNAANFKSNNYLSAFENLVDRYNLQFNDASIKQSIGEYKTDGVNCWKVYIRGYKHGVMPNGRMLRFYCTLYLNAGSRNEATELVECYMNSKNEFADLYLQMARIPEETLTSKLNRCNTTPQKPCVWFETDRTYAD